MSVRVDPRLVARRRQVQEGWARRRLRWIVALVALVFVGGVGFALFRSPWLAIRTVAVFGAEHAAVAEVLADHHLAAGVPTVSVRPGAIEAALLDDPWVARAEVRVTWPGAVEVTVLERRAAAWLQTPGGWVLAADDGVVLQEGSPGADDAAVTVRLDALAPGDRIADAEVVGALEFMSLLPPELGRGAVAEVLPTGIEAQVAGHDVLLGNRRDMAEKVAALVALLEQDLDPAALLNVISPDRPGVANPQPSVENTEEEVSSSDASG